MGTGWIVLLALLGLLILLAVIVLVRMAACRPPQKKPVQKKEYDVDPETLAEHLSGAVQIRTIAGQSVEDTPCLLYTSPGILSENFDTCRELHALRPIRLKPFKADFPLHIL